MATLTNDEVSMLRNSHALAEARAETEAARLVKRRAAADEVAAIERRIAERNRTNGPLIEAAIKGIRKAEEALKAANDRLAAAQLAASNVVDESRAARLRQQLRQDAAPAIDRFITRLGAAEEAVRAEHGNRPRPVGFRDAPEVAERWGRPEEAAAERRRIAGERKAAMDFRTKLDSFRSARVAADALREAALSDDELDAELNRIGETVGIE